MESSEKQVIRPFPINKQLLFNVFSYLNLVDLSRLSSTCRRLYVQVQSYVQDLHVLVEDAVRNDVNNDLSKNHLVLKRMNPARFFFPTPPFQRVTKLFLQFDLVNGGKIDLTELRFLTHLKIRGPLIALSPNRLPTVTHVDIENVECCERQVFPNLEEFVLEFDTGKLSDFYNLPENKTLEFIFVKALDILNNKMKIESVQITFTVYLDIKIFEKFVDEVESFLNNYDIYVDNGKVTIVVRHNSDFGIDNQVKLLSHKAGLKLRRRYDAAFRQLTHKLPKQHHNFRIILEEQKN